jgi:hypothetical protein
VPSSPPEVHSPDAQTPKPATEPSLESPVKASAAAEKPKRNRKKGGGKNPSFDDAKDASNEPVKDLPK